MTGRWQGWILAALHLALVSSLAGKYRVDRATLPHGWVRTQTYDPDLPIRGRYVQLRLETRVEEALRTPAFLEAQAKGYGQPVARVRWGIDAGGLVLRHSASGETIWLRPEVPLSQGDRQRRLFLSEPVAYFIPEKVADPTRRPAAEELWVEVTVPRRGPPRPIRLGVKRAGVLTPLDLD